jgi:glycosyltransferase involved in cell wall biosynthesis
LHDRVFELIWKLYYYRAYLEYYCKSYQLARQESADIYYAIDLATLPGAWVCKVLRGGKLLYDSRELWLDYKLPPRSKMNRLFVKRCESFLIRRTDANVAAGVSAGKELSRRYSIPQPVVLLNVPEYRPFEHSTVFRDKLGIPAGQRVLLCMGTLRPDLGIEQAIYSLNYLSNCSLVIFGFGLESYLSELKKVIRNEGLAERVYFSPGVPWDEVTRYAMSADVGLVLQQNVGLSYYYVSPCKLFESIVAGLPIVGSNLPDLKMYIEGYNIGVTCDQTNPREIADAINHILSDDKRYSEMKKNALEAAKILNWDNESSKLIALCEKLSRRR